MKLKARSRD